MNSAALFAYVAAIFGGLMAIGIVWQGRRAVAPWSLAAGLVLLSLEALFSGLSADALLLKSAVGWQSLMFCAISFLPGVWLLFSFTYARGNAGEFLARWRLLIGAAFVLPVGLALFFYDDLFVVKEQALGLGSSGYALNLLFLLSAVLVLMNFERTFRTSVGTMRWRIKFMLLGLGVLFIVRAYTSSQMLLFRAVNPALETVNSGALLVACFLMLRSLFRTGHFEVNVYPSQSVLHNSLTVVLAGLYLIIVGVFAKLVSVWGGDTAFTIKAFVILISLVGLTIILLSDKVRLQTRRFVSRHFQRPFYDYRTLWRSFTERTAEHMDQVELCRATVKLVADIFQVLSVTIWLVNDKKQELEFVVSTSLSEAQAKRVKLQPEEAQQVIEALKEEFEPVDIDLSRKRWAVVLRQCQPDEFRKGGNRVCVPVAMGGQVLGLIMLGDRVSGLGFSQQDFDLLKCVGDQTAASLRNVQLSQKLLQAKELEAFQTMSAFFVHDLKNTASTLNLMLQNLPVHFGDPAFREDALRGISKSVTHINQLISRLTHLRQALKIQPTEADLNTLVAKALEGWPTVAGTRMDKNLQPLPKVFLDQEQMLKVVTNLVLNATEAVPKEGLIRIETTQVNGWAILSVADNGCGMSPEFANGSLFRPFQTTKKNGLGIGMFQSKMIVESHGGKIEVQSEVGKGTCFRVFLPCKNQINEAFTAHS
ncbi:XrtA/PEP-CTERM system histidine kinase PrsK [Pedosphaera parvula]|uniref:histidine kinase n=1 Tax=Pedosphaera parvula (strain Ellin514) TaxID=320771 RepID=B9XD48_PEDPL|nr:XrtA/PEP-CTERM system histidine kinase PrsK [Pedosphaera parvula]EEF62394.1 multi-sensor signal transduction histidine kinase [Pedosphaera parvula Ellin514]